ncbi:MAG: hypothetical protein QOE55_5444 [Acidobacteriaceae bacterium]|nr:hypothetical protein [Acidobacteriaceae bacterium]
MDPLVHRRHQLQAKVVVYGDLDILFGAKITLGGLDGGVSQEELDLLEIPAILPAQLGAGTAQVVAPKCSIPICFDDCSTIDQTAQSLSVSRLTFPLFETDRSSRPSSMPAAIIQALIPCLTQMGMATVRMRRPLPSRSASIQRPSRCWMVSTSSSASSLRRRAQPTKSHLARKQSLTPPPLAR